MYIIIIIIKKQVFVVGYSNRESIKVNRFIFG